MSSKGKTLINAFVPINTPTLKETLSLKMFEFASSEGVAVIACERHKKLHASANSNTKHKWHQCAFQVKFRHWNLLAAEQQEERQLRWSGAAFACCDKAPRLSISIVVWILSSETALFVSSTNSIQIVRRQCCLDLVSMRSLRTCPKDDIWQGHFL